MDDSKKDQILHALKLTALTLVAAAEGELELAECYRQEAERLASLIREG